MMTNPLSDSVDAYLVRLKSVYQHMDAAYDTVAKEHEFQCMGCEENCCYSTFYHHTLVEYLYLKKGFDLLSEEVKIRIRDKAESDNQIREASQENRVPFKLMCPANQDDRCLLYEYRPMICRLHGIAHQLKRQDGSSIEGPGCDLFEVAKTKGNIQLLDRTSHYVALSRLERELREAVGFMSGIKMTISQMLVAEGIL